MTRRQEPTGPDESHGAAAEDAAGRIHGADAGDRLRDADTDGGDRG